MQRLKKLIKTWENLCEEALEKLHTCIVNNHGDNNITMLQVIQGLGINPDLVRFCPEEMMFLS